MEKKEKIYIGIIVILVLVLGIVIGFLIKGNQNNSADGKNNSNNTTENVKEISDETKKELLNIVGLTEKGYKRMTTEEAKDYDKDVQEKVAKGNYVEVSGFSLLRAFADLGKDKEIVIKDASNDNIKSIILKYAMANNLLNHEVRRTNKAGNGIDMGISFADYKTIAKKYNLNENGETYFNSNYIYNGYYLYDGIGTVSGFAIIEDSMNFETKGKDIVLTYNTKLNYEDEGPANSNEKMTFTFKQYDDGTYYLYSVKTVNQ